MRDQGFRGSAKRANTSSPDPDPRSPLDSLPEGILDKISTYLDTNYNLRNTSKQYNSQLCPKQFSSRACELPLHPDEFKKESEKGLGKRVNLTGCIPNIRQSQFFYGLCLRLRNEKCFTEELKINYNASLRPSLNVINHIPNVLAAAKYLKTLTLIFNFDKFTDSILPVNSIMQAIAPTRTCSTLKLGWRISDTQGVSIAQYLIFNESVTSLDVSDNLLGFNFIRLLSNITLKTNTSLTRLNLSANRIGGRALHTLSHINVNGDDVIPQSPLKYLNLMSNQITDFHELGAFLSRFQSLTYLNLSFNRVTDPGQEDVDMMDDDTFITAIQHCSLTELDLSNNYIGEATLRPLMIGVAKNPSLTKLNLHTNKIGLENLRILGQEIARHGICKLRELNLKKNSIGKGLANAVNDLFTACPSLTYCNVLSNINQGESTEREELLQLIGMVRDKNVSLGVINPYTTTYVDYDSWDEIAILISDISKEMSDTLKTLDLSFINLRQKILEQGLSIDTFANILKNHKSLTCCNLLQNELSEDDVGVLIRAVEDKRMSLCNIGYGRTLCEFEEMNLGVADLTLLAADLLRPGVTKHVGKSLTSLRFNDVSFKATILPLVYTLKSMSALKKLNS